MSTSKIRNYEKTKTFLRTLVDFSNRGEGLAISKLATKSKIDYCATLPTVLQNANLIEHIENKNKERVYVCNFKAEEITDEFVIMLNGFCKDLITEYKANHKAKTINPGIKTIVGINSKVLEDSLESYQDGALLRELKRRGYTGSLEKVTIIKLG